MTTTTTVPAKYDVGLDGRGYMIDTQYLEAYRSQTLDPIRRQADTSDSVGEASLNPEGYWRRSPESFHKGAGQARYDANDSDPERFQSSAGVDVWTKGQLSLLPATEEIGTLAITSGSTVRDALVAEPFSFVLDSLGTIYKTSTLTGPLSIANSWSGPLGNITAFDLLGGSGFIIDSNKLYETDSSFTSGGGGTLWIADNPDINDIRAVGGRLFCTSGGNLYDISETGLTTLPTPLTSLAQSNIVATETNGYFYFLDGRGNILKTTIKADGSGLEIPTVAASIPAGETFSHLIGYLNFVIAGSSTVTNGWALRMAIAGADGTLTLGARFAENVSNQPIAFQLGETFLGQFVYLTMFNGLLRLDLSTINDALEPAWAADVAFTGQPRAAGIGTTGVIYAIEDDGTFFRTTSSFVTSATLRVGEVSFGTREPKLFLDPQETADDGTVSHLLTVDGVGVSNGNIGPAAAATWRMDFFPTTAGQDMTVQYPILRALPSPAYIEIKSVPILLHDQIINRQSQAEQVDTDAQLDYLRGLRDAGTLIDYQDGGKTYQAQVIGVDWVASQRDLAGDQWNGTAVVRMKVLQ